MIRLLALPISRRFDSTWNLEVLHIGAIRMQRVPVSSSQLTSIGYDPATLTLEVEFRKGGVYQYVGISAETHEQLMAAESIGTFFNTMIREGGFAYVRVS